MDRLTSGLLADFSRQYELQDKEEEKQFEALATFLAVSQSYNESFEPYDLTTGDGNDTGIDGIGILINGALVTDIDMVRDIADASGFVDVDFVFVQAERTAGFSSAKIGQFGFGVTDFFSDPPRLERNQAIADAAEIMALIYKTYSGKFRRRPNCHMYYVTTGIWNEEPALTARIANVVDDLTGLAIFDAITFTPIDAGDLQRRYADTKNAITREVTFSARIPIPEIPGVTEAYLGIISATAFLSLLQDATGDIVKNIFYDNVRDFQGYNAVNDGMKDTLRNADIKSRFVLMNNGITVIAKEMRVTGNRVALVDYQIVNGCQTSHVLHNQRDVLDDSVMVPLRVIATKNDDVVADIIKATNRQTQVGEEHLLALSDMQKKLEQYFTAFEPQKRLYYERRSRQYSADPNVEKTRVVTLANVIRAFAAMFLGEPHRTTRNFKALLEQVGRGIFGSDDRLAPYYVSAFALYRLEYLFRSQLIDSKYKKARYQLIFAFVALLPLGEKPRMNAREMDRYCDKILVALYDNERSAKVFTKAAELVSRAAGGALDRDQIRTQPFTDTLRTLCSESRFPAELLD